MKNIPILLISTPLSFFCLKSSAQENPFMEMAGKKYAEYCDALELTAYKPFMYKTDEEAAIWIKANR